MFAMNKLFALGSKVGPKSRSRSAQLGIESLEAREVPAVWLDVDGTLVYDGWHDVVKDDVSVSTSSDGGITVHYKIFETVILPSFTIPALYADESYSPGTVSRIVFYGGLGNDKFTNNTSLPSSAFGGSGNDTLAGGSVTDNLFGEGDADSLLGGGGRDKLYGEGGKDTLRGGAGNDTLLGGSEGDRLYGDANNDSLDGGAGIDSLYGGTGNDTLLGGPEGDRLYGEANRDLLRGDDGADSLYGGTGNDTLHGGKGIDRLYGNDNDDMLYGHNGEAASLAERDYLYGGKDRDTLFGEGGDDYLSGNDGDDVLRGGDGRDSLYGNNHNDRLYGEIGRDYLNGGANNDVLFGGVLDVVHLIIGGGDYSEDAQDTIYGGTGIDRFLAGRTDLVQDLTSIDAKIVFAPGGNRVIDDDSYPASRWTDQEIERMDWVFATLQSATGNTKLLKRANGDPMVFYRHDGQSRGKNMDAGKEILLTDFMFDGSDNWLRGYVLHEIGHNWESNIGFSRWMSFLYLGDWDWLINVDNPSATYASGYAQTDAEEDWAESFAAYFLDLAGEGWYTPWDGAGASAIPEKIALIDSWVDSL